MSRKTKAPKRFFGPDRLESYIDEFWRSYMHSALWSTNDVSDERGGEPLDANYTIDDIDSKTTDDMREDCAKFVVENEDLLDGWPADTAGHCFWLTRNGHGAGFWDHDEGAEGSGKELSEKCGWKTKFPEVNLYVGDDGEIYQR